MSAAVAVQPRSTRDVTRPLAVAGALAATLAIWLIAHPLAGVDLAVHSVAGDAVAHVGPASVALAVLLAGLAACGLLSAIERFARRPRTTWSVIAYTTLALSLAGPIALGETNGAIATLTSMHLAAAGILIPALGRSSQRRVR
ncbi:MAG: hypothetical protein QOG94_1262 [Solirubrobacteraceae bacterium]|nr:hypothetical protein [Solirubrobacteraceae bacterium]